jgi:hypothetical protein
VENEDTEEGQTRSLRVNEFQPQKVCLLACHHLENAHYDVCAFFGVVGLFATRKNCNDDASATNAIGNPSFKRVDGLILIIQYIIILLQCHESLKLVTFLLSAPSTFLSERTNAKETNVASHPPPSPS